MYLREATISDIEQMNDLRLAVKENVLSNPALVTREDYIVFLTTRGKGWVAETGTGISGFAIADLTGNNVWALFVHPEFEGTGIGKTLHNIMLQWYFNQTNKTIWLSTAYNTRAVEFYKRNGWKEAGNYSNKELKFEMDFESWQNRQMI